MALWHLQELQSALEQRGWRLSQELPGDDHKISATWLLTRSGAPPNELHLDFEGLDEKRVLPLAEAYACQVRGASQSLYFRRRGDNDPPARERWESELDAFVAGLPATCA
jgi:hypothetical protein